MLTRPNEVSLRATRRSARARRQAARSSPSTGLASPRRGASSRQPSPRVHSTRHPPLGKVTFAPVLGRRAGLGTRPELNNKARRGAWVAEAHVTTFGAGTLPSSPAQVTARRGAGVPTLGRRAGLGPRPGLRNTARRGAGAPTLGRRAGLGPRPGLRNTARRGAGTPTLGRRAGLGPRPGLQDTARRSRYTLRIRGSS